jgi:hypothetical protein
MKLSHLSLPAFLCLALGVASIAESAVVYGNLGVSGTGAITNTNTDMGPGINFFIAQGFTAASPNLDVTSITLGLFGDGSIPTTVGIYADNFGQPAASALYTSAVTTVGAKDLYNFSFTGAQLTNGSSYWVIPQSDVSWYTATPVPAGLNSSGYTFTQTLETFEGGWAAAGSNRYSLSVQAVPEPTTYALGAIGIAAAGLARWRRRLSGGAC